MNIIILSIFSIGVLQVTPPAFAARSSQMTNYEITQCRAQQKCFQVKGKLAYLSQKLDSISGSNAMLDIYDPSNMRNRTHVECNSLSFNFNTQFLICDNSDTPHSKSLTITSNLEINTMLSNHR